MTKEEFIEKVENNRIDFDGNPFSVLCSGFMCPTCYFYNDTCHKNMKINMYDDYSEKIKLINERIENFLLKEKAKILKDKLT